MFANNSVADRPTAALQAPSEGMHGAGETAGFSVWVPSTARFDHLLAARARFSIAQLVQKGDPEPEDFIHADLPTPKGRHSVR
jgi:hypothetical protein